MIAVIADDFTGAAEIGGVGIRHGFRVVIETAVDQNIDTDILIIATDSRSQSAAKAAALTERITSELLALHPDFIYKKVDSILRGNVREELAAQLKASAMTRALLVPANPALKRTIQNGVYYYDGQLLNNFNFSSGAPGKRGSSSVLELIGDVPGHSTSVISCENPLPDKGLLIGNTTSSSDLESWVSKIDSRTIPAGSSGFFDAILRARKEQGSQQPKPIELGEAKLYVCGSAFINSRLLVRAALESGQAVCYMPENLFLSNKQNEMLTIRWTGEIIRALRERKKAIVAIDKLHTEDVENVSSKIKEALAGVIESVMCETKVDELVIEGGATAYSIIQKLGYTRFYPSDELGPGTIRMKVKENKDLFLTLKPGSYSWPESIWRY
jgi:D-threonate/D-erythronate kinase